jgi:hypothetical protein
MFSLDDKLPLYSIFILFLIITAGFITELFPCKLIRVVKNNIYLKHFFAFLTLLFMIVLTESDKNSNILNIILKSVFIYIIFIFTLKTHYKFFIIIIILLGLLYILTRKQNEFRDSINEEKDEIEKNKFINLDNILTLINNIIFILVIILIIFGFLIYYGEKKYEYKKDFNNMIFLFGKPDCSQKESNISIINSLKYAFK